MGFNDRDYYRPSGFGGFSYFPQVVKQILFINLIVFLIQIIAENLVIGGVSGDAYLSRYFALNGFHPQLNFQIWQLVTYQFMHADFSHIFWNMLLFWMFGSEIANMYGDKKFWIFYLLCGVGAGLLQVLIGDPSITVGASGAVYGVMIAFAMFNPDRLIYIYFVLPVKAKYLMGFIFVIDFFMIGSGGAVAHLAHIGGAITGALYVLLDKNSDFSYKIKNWMNSYKSPGSSGSSNKGFSFRKPYKSDEKVKEAHFYDIKDSKSSDEVSQEEIDRILDKISQSGYQNLTDKEKRILFEASKKN